MVPRPARASPGTEPYPRRAGSPGARNTATMRDREPVAVGHRDPVRDRRGRPGRRRHARVRLPAGSAHAPAPHVVAAAGRAGRRGDRPPRPRERARGLVAVRARRRALAALEPDLIVTQELCAVCAVSYEIVDRAAKRLRGDPRVVSLEPSSLEDVFSTIAFLGELVGARDGAARLAGDAARARRRAARARRRARTRERAARAGMDRSADERRPLDARLDRARRRRARARQSGREQPRAFMGRDRRRRPGRRDRRAVRIRTWPRAARDRRAPARRGARVRVAARRARPDAPTRWTATRSSTARDRVSSTPPSCSPPRSPAISDQPRTLLFEMLRRDEHARTSAALERVRGLVQAR